jgi:hypothetical protein
MPENLTSAEPPAWWSQRHWELICNSGRQLQRFGDDTVLTPLNHTLLTMLAETDAKLAAEITDSLIPSATEYSTDPAAYHAARRRVLAALDKAPGN